MNRPQAAEQVLRHQENKAFGYAEANRRENLAPQ
jgi:hypothetical protein